MGGVLVPDFQLAQGEHLMRAGQLEQGRALLRDAAAKLRAQSGPDAWIQTLFALEGIARLAREQGDWILAAEMTDAMRQHDPRVHRPGLSGGGFPTGSTSRTSGSSGTTPPSRPDRTPGNSARLLVLPKHGGSTGREAPAASRSSTTRRSS